MLPGLLLSSPARLLGDEVLLHPDSRRIPLKEMKKVCRGLRKQKGVTQPRQEFGGQGRLPGKPNISDKPKRQSRN